MSEIKYVLNITRVNYFCSFCFFSLLKSHYSFVISGASDREANSKIITLLAGFIISHRMGVRYILQQN